MSVREFAGRILYYVFRPVIHIFLKGSRRAYVVVIRDEKILVVKNILGSGKWHLPGGGCHASESFAEGAARELKEEVGITVDAADLRQLSNGSFKSKRAFDYGLFLFAANTPLTIHLDRLEILDAVWISPNDLNESNAGESTLKAFELISQ